MPSDFKWQSKQSLDHLLISNFGSIGNKRIQCLDNQLCVCTELGRNDRNRQFHKSFFQSKIIHKLSRPNMRNRSRDFLQIP